MNRNLILVFILLATLFTVNAVPHQQLLDKRTIKFNQCPIKDAATLTVTVVPDPVAPRSTASFSVFGTLASDITAGTSFLLIVFADSTGRKILTDVHFQVFTQSFSAGSTISIMAADVPTPDELPDVYTIGVGIGNPELGDPISPITVYGCTYAVIGQ